MKAQIRLRGHHCKEVDALLVNGWVSAHKGLPALMDFLKECISKDPELVLSIKSKRHGPGPEADVSKEGSR